MPNVNKWSRTAANNANADPDINWAEGQAPSTVNNSARQEMAGVANDRDDTRGQLTMAGGTTAYTLATNSVNTTYQDGLMLCAKVNATSTGAITLNVDSIGVRKVYRASGGLIGQAQAGDFQTGHLAVLLYDDALDSATGGFQLLNPPADRGRLAGDVTYYVRTDGSDSNDGLANTSGGAFLTLQKAWNVIAQLDLGGHTVTIQANDATRTAGIVMLYSPVGGLVIIQGNTGTPDNCVISVTSAHCIAITGPQSCPILIQGFRFQTTTAGDGISIQAAANVTLGTHTLGACAANQVRTYDPGAVLNFTAGPTIKGGAVCGIYCQGGKIFLEGRQFVTTGSPTITTVIQSTHGGQIHAASMTTPSGSITGQRWAVSRGGGIDVGGNVSGTYFPGSTAGSADAASYGWSK